MAERTLDDIAVDVMKSDTVSRLNAAQELQEYLQDLANPVYCENFDRLVDALASWVNSSNFKVSSKLVHMHMNHDLRFSFLINPYLYS